jgi:hypothetical protein
MIEFKSKIDPNRFVLPPVKLTQAQSALYEELPEAIKVAVPTHVPNSSTDMALDNVSAILITARLRSELRTEILKNNYITLRDIKDAALKAERLRKVKPLKTNNSVNEINDQEPEIDAVNNRGNFQNNYRGNNSRGRGGYPPARGGYRGSPNNNGGSNKGTPPTNQGRGAYRGNRGNQSQGNRAGQNQNNVGSNDKDNCKYCKKPGHSVENCWKLQAKKAAMNVSNENEFHEDNNEQTQEEDTPVSSVFNAQSYSKNQ